jgi:hypothetical protein
VNQPGNKTSITKKDRRRLQVLQNKTMRIQTNDGYRTPTTLLLQKTRQLSIHQMVAYHSAVQVYNIAKNKEPKYHYNRLFGANENQHQADTRQNHLQVNFQLSLARGSKIWAALPEATKIRVKP